MNELIEVFLLSFLSFLLVVPKLHPDLYSPLSAKYFFSYESGQMTEEQRIIAPEGKPQL